MAKRKTDPQFRERQPCLYVKKNGVEVKVVVERLVKATLRKDRGVPEYYVTLDGETLRVAEEELRLISAAAVSKTKVVPSATPVFTVGTPPEPILRIQDFQPKELSVLRQEHPKQGIAVVEVLTTCERPPSVPPSAPSPVQVVTASPLVQSSRREPRPATEWMRPLRFTTYDSWGGKPPA